MTSAFARVLAARRGSIAALNRLVNARRAPRVAPPPLDEVIRGARTPLALIALLEGRSNAAREAAVAR